MGYTPKEGAAKILDVIAKAEGFTVKLFANDISANTSYLNFTLADFTLLTTETSWGGWGTSTSHRTLTTSAWTTAALGTGEVARSTAADKTWTFTTAIASTNHTGTLTNGATLISNLAGASVLILGMKVEYPTAVSTNCTITSLASTSSVGISEAAGLTTASATIPFRPQIHGHILIGSSSSFIYRVVSHTGFSPTKYGDYYSMTPTLVIMEE